MKEKIKKFLKEWLTFFMVMAIAFLMLAIVFACIGEYNDSLCYLAIALFCGSTVIKDKRIELMQKIIDSHEDEYKRYEQELADMEDSALYYHLKWLHAKNDVKLCKRKISLTVYLNRRKLFESKIEKMEKLIEERKKKQEEKPKE